MGCLGLHLCLSSLNTNFNMIVKRLTLFCIYKSPIHTHYTLGILIQLPVMQIDPHIIPYIQRARLYDFHLVAYFRVDRAIIIAILKRWCLDTHTFHLPLGEVPSPYLTQMYLHVFASRRISCLLLDVSYRAGKMQLNVALRLRSPIGTVRGSGLRIT